MKKWLNKKLQIYRHNFLENLLSFIIVCVATLVMLWLMLWNELNSTQPVKTMPPEYEFIEIKEPIIEEAEIELEINSLPLPLISDAVPIEAKQILNAHDGVAYGPSGKETYYNLPMDRVVQIMRDKGYTEADYPYIVRDDGVKCLGDYVIVAADLSEHPRGSIVETSLGQGIVCDTGEQLTGIIDIAVNW